MSGVRRNQHLLNGRRVQVLDLIKAGLVNVGDVFVYRRPQAGEEHTAVVDRRGHLVLSDGQVFKTLSGAASALSGTNVDGWEVWTTQNSRRVLDALRQELLAANVEPADSDDESAQSEKEDSRSARHTFLRAAKAKADSEPEVVSVRDLLGYWDADSRDADLDQQIDAELANYGLGTEPHYAAVGLNERVTIKSASQLQTALSARDGDGGTQKAGRESHTQHARGLSASPTTVRGLTVGNLLSASAGVEAVTPDASLEEAITKMMINDYSQLAVMTGDRNLTGAVSWRSIARARNIDPDSPLKAAIFTAQEFSYSTDLIQALPVLDEDDFFFVRGPRNEISGIVTAADVVRAYRDMASPFLMIGEIDQMLRWIIEVTFDNETIVTTCDPSGKRKLKSVTQLTIGDYKHILDHPDRWFDLEWRLDRRVFCDQLDEVRKVRNSVMHFNGDPVAERTTRMLRHFILLLREYGTA